MTTSDISLLDFPPAGPVPLEEVAIQLHADDNVAIAKVNLPAGMLLDNGSGERFEVQQLVPMGHKFALGRVAPGTIIKRYGQPIGVAAQAIAMGEHVHTANLGMIARAERYEFGAATAPTAYYPADQRRTFLGYGRPDGRVGTRNYIAVISTVNCAAHVCGKIADHFAAEQLAAYPNVDGVIALTHTAGCGGIQAGSLDYALLQRTLAGMVRHPNVGAAVLVGLGCETNQLDALIANHALQEGDPQAPLLATLMIQDLGGIKKTVAAGIAAVNALLPAANATARTPQPLAELKLALECGGSDSWSGITANPLVGAVADEIVREGGTAVISETTEAYGAEALLLSRAASPEVGRKLLDKLQWWDTYLERQGFEFDNNPAPGNKAGGLTNIVEKSLGAIAKGGTTNLNGVLDYAEVTADRGFLIMDTPGFDPISITGKVAGGCNLVLFTTGRGSVFGFPAAPTIKIATNSAMFAKMEDDMDFDAGRLLQKGSTLAAAAAELLDLLIRVASGQASKSEAQGVGREEFVPWQTGGVI